MLESIKHKLDKGFSLTIVGFGDSLTQGWMVSKGYLDFLKEMLSRKYPKSNVTIVNRGIPGDTAQGGLYRIGYDVIDFNPDLVLLQFALNDAVLGYSADQFRLSIEEIIERIQNDTSAEIILLTSSTTPNPVMNEIAEKFYEILISIAEARGIAIAKVHDYWKKKIAEGKQFKKLLQADQVHPTTEGYRLMSESVMELL